MMATKIRSFTALPDVVSERTWTRKTTPTATYRGYSTSRS